MYAGIYIYIYIYIYMYMLAFISCPILLLPPMRKIILNSKEATQNDQIQMQNYLDIIALSISINSIV